MEETGVVKELRGDHALVVVVKKETGCEGCPGNTLCKSTTESEALIEAINEVGAKEGDRVRIVFRSMSYLKGILLVYALPAFMLVIGAIIGKEFVAPTMPDKNPEALSAFMGLGFFVLSFLVVKLLSVVIKKKKSYTPSIVEVI